MISDVLFEAVAEIDRYLETKTYDRIYSGDLREEIIALRNSMEAMKVKLDTPPVSA